MDVWAIIGIGALVWIVLVVIIGGFFIAVKRANREINDYMDEPRCDITGQPLTPRQQYERESG